MEKFICAFSSDSRILYLADIYKVLSLPDNFVIHFRYKKKYIEQKILNDLNSYIGKTVIIFFTHTDGLNSTSFDIPVRKAILIKAEIVEQTGLFHAYMQLSNFCEVELPALVSNNLVPPITFFSEIEFNENIINKTWIDKINNLKKYFPNHSFYNIKSIKSIKGKIQNIKISKDKKGCFYRLKHGTKYLIDLSIGNPNESNCKIHFLSSSDDITANMQNPIEVTAQYDDIIVPIYLKSLNVSTESSFIRFIPCNKKTINSEFALNIEIEKKIGFRRVLNFGFFSLLTIISLLIIKENSESIGNIGHWKWNINWKVVLACITLFISSSILFSRFNKK